VTTNAVHRSRGMRPASRAISQCPVRPGEAGAADLASKDCHLVAQHKDLGVLGERVPPRQPEESEGAMDQAVEEGEHQASSLADSILAGQDDGGQFLYPSGSHLIAEGISNLLVMLEARSTGSVSSTSARGAEVGPGQERRLSLLSPPRPEPLRLLSPARRRERRGPAPRRRRERPPVRRWAPAGSARGLR
jgi:hypothetical protein